MPIHRITFAGVGSLLAIMLASGCSDYPGEATPAKFARLELAMPLAEVESIMGGPGEIRAFDGQPASETTYRWDASDSGYHVYVTFRDDKAGSLVAYD